MSIQNVAPAGELRSINPTSGELMRTFETISGATLERKLQLAADTFTIWRLTAFDERSRLMLRCAEVLERQKNQHARLMTLEMGKPLRAAVQEVEKCARTCRYYAENAASFLADEPASSGAAHTFIRYQPLGPVLAIMPWNFPFWQVFRFAAPGLMAGNVGLLKHAPSVPQCALAIENVFLEAGFPEGVFQALLIGIDPVPAMLGDARIRAVTLTGSVAAGSSVAATAGRHVKKSVLELGGSDPFIVMPSADLQRITETAVQARIVNNGQSCIAAKRFIVHDAIYDEFERRFVERMAALKTGDPLEDGTDVGPLASADLLARLEDQVKRTVAAGARVLLGGTRLGERGYFYAPTVLAQIPAHTPARDDEMFGPVASLFRVRGIEEAIDLANDSRFGLGSSCWTNDPYEREMFIERIESGVAFVNGMVASDPRIPFGGIKQSGYGRELGVQGIREFVNIKTVAIYDTADQRRGA